MFWSKSQELKLDINLMSSPDGEIIRRGTLFKGGHYRLEQGFDIN